MTERNTTLDNHIHFKEQAAFMQLEMNRLFIAEGPGSKGALKLDSELCAFLDNRDKYVSRFEFTDGLRGYAGVGGVSFNGVRHNDLVTGRPLTKVEFDRVN